MATEIYLPRLGESIEEATLSNYLKKVGDLLDRGDVIAELETAKAMMELESPVKGVLLAVFPEVGQTINRGTLVAIVGKEGEDWQTQLAAKAEAEPSQEEPVEEPRLQTELQAEKKPEQPRLNISPNARRLAKEHNINLKILAERFPGKRISAEDILHFVKESQASAQGGLGTKPVSMTETQRMTAIRMKQSAVEIPQFSVTIEVGVEHLIERKNACEAAGFRCSITALLVEVLAKSLQKHPRFNTCFKDDRILQYEQINISVAMAVSEGLVAPVIVNADKLDLQSITEQLAALQMKAEQRKLAYHEIENGTFTISNLGMKGIRTFVPMVVPQQAAILGVGEIYPTFLVDKQNQLIQRSNMMLTLSADHRVVGGMECAEFLNSIKSIIEDNQED